MQRVTVRRDGVVLSCLVAGAGHDVHLEARDTWVRVLRHYISR